MKPLNIIINGLDNISPSMIFPDVTFNDLATVYIDNIDTIEIGKGTLIEPSVKLTGNIKIGEECKIYFDFEAHNFSCGNNCELGGKITHSKFGNNCKIGKFAEITRSIFGNNITAKHHCYIGDAIVDDGVNIGAGAITANYDGKKKNKTRIGKKAFIGVNSCLIAPLYIGHESLIAAGSVITKKVPAHALAICRVKDQVIKKNFWQKKGKYWQRIPKK